MRVNYAIVFVGDMDRSVAFYRDVIGLQLKFESPAWTEFGTDPPCLQFVEDVLDQHRRPLP